MVKVTRIKLVDRLFLLGPPGIGKSEIIKQLAQEEAKKLGLEFVDLREADENKINEIISNPSKYYVFLHLMCPHIMPEDLSVPIARDVLMGKNFYKVATPQYLHVFTLKDIHGTLFLDELTNVQRSDQMTMYFSIFNEKLIGLSAKLSDNVKVVAAGNPTKWSSVANELPLPMRMGRTIIVKVDPPSVDEWYRYMVQRYGDKWDQRIYEYLKYNKNDFFESIPEGAGASISEIGENSAIACPRSWTRLAIELYKLKQLGVDDDDPFIEEVVRGLLGDRIGPKVLQYLRTKLTDEVVEKIKKGDIETYRRLSHSDKILLFQIIAQKQPNEILEFKPLFRYLAENERENLAYLKKIIPPAVFVKLASSDPEINQLFRLIPDTPQDSRTQQRGGQQSRGTK